MSRPAWQIQQQRIQQQRRDFQRGQGYIMNRRREMKQQGYHHNSGFGSAVVGAGLGGVVGGPVGVAIGGVVGWLIGKLR